MEKYVHSKFNTIMKTDNKMCIYNSLTGVIAKLESINIQEVFTSNKEDFDRLDSNTLKALSEDGFIVEQDVDEHKMAEVKYLDIVANKELYLTLIPTTNCNFRCSYCYQNNPCDIDNFQDIEMDGDVQNRIVKYVDKNLKYFYGLFIEWYGGEPLLQLSIISELSKKLVDICQKRGKPYYSTLTTNGFFLTASVLKKCLESHIFSFHVTLDGFEEFHNRFRCQKNGDGTYEKIINNLKSIRDTVGSKYFKIIIRTNISNELLPYLNEWMEFLYNEFAGDKRFYFFFRPVEDRGGEAVKNVRSSILTNMKEAYRIMINSPYKLDFSHIRGYLYNSVCSATKRNVYIIDPLGIIKKCGEHLKNDLSRVGYLGNEGELHIDKNNFSKWISFEQRLKEPQCTYCNMKAACFNANCPFEVITSKCKFYCGYEHENIHQVIDLLTQKDYNFIRKY